MPIAHGEGSFFADQQTIDDLENNQRIVFRYCNSSGVTDRNSNPNGSINNIAGIISEHGNVMGLMPHPERVCDALLGGSDGLGIFHSLAQHFAAV
jgi:phosphoribosylformylglycinamidine synthase